MSNSKGILESSLGATFWGLSATASSALFSFYTVPYLVLLLFRSTISAAVMLLLFRPRLVIKDIKVLSLYGIVGLLGSQLTYLATIFYTNATTATVIQFLFLPIVLVYDIMKKNRRFRFSTLIAMVASVVGLLLLTLNLGENSQFLAISPLGLLFGISSALTAAASVIFSRSLVQSLGLASTVTYGFAFGAIGSIAIGVVPTVSFFAGVASGSLPVIMSLILFVAVVGTLAAYTLFIASMRYIDATQASFLSSFEPISAAVSSYAFLRSVLTFLQYLGGAVMVVSAIVAQRRRTGENEPATG